MENCWYIGQRADLYGMKVQLAQVWQRHRRKISFAEAKTTLYPQEKKERVKNAHKNV